jgi:hypothetical protein
MDAGNEYASGHAQLQCFLQSQTQLHGITCGQLQHAEFRKATHGGATESSAILDCRQLRDCGQLN